MSMEFTASITITSEDGDVFELSLSEVQLATVLIILGITDVKENQCTCYSDETLEAFHKMEGNPLRLK